MTAPVTDNPAANLPASDRQHVLARLLTTSTTSIPIDHLCLTLDITRDDLEADVAALTPTFAALGFAIQYGNNSSVRLIRGADPAGDAAEQRIGELRDAERGMHRSAAQTLYRAMNGTLSGQGVKGQERVNIGILTNRGALNPPTRRNRADLTDDTKFSLMLEEDDPTV
ncbi:hypothetical protein [Nostocoides australiense]